MKKFSVFFAKAIPALFLCAILFTACKGKSAPDTLDKDASYAFGMLMAQVSSEMTGLAGIHFDYDAFKNGFRDFNEARETRFTQEQMMEKIIAAITEIHSRYEEEHGLQHQQESDDWYEEWEKEWQLMAQTNLEEGNAYLAQNRTQSGVTTTSSGLQYEVISRGSGERPGPEDIVRVHYEGTYIDGGVFDSSYSRGSPTEFPLHLVISGWTEGIQLMNVGSTYRFVVPSNLAYGPDGYGDIPPNKTLIFRVELLSIIK